MSKTNKEKHTEIKVFFEHSDVIWTECHYFELVFTQVVYVSIPGKKLGKNNTKITNIFYWEEFYFLFLFHLVLFFVFGRQMTSSDFLELGESMFRSYIFSRIRRKYV